MLKKTIKCFQRKKQTNCMSNSVNKLTRLERAERDVGVGERERERERERETDRQTDRQTD